MSAPDVLSDDSHLLEKKQEINSRIHTDLVV